MFSKIEKLVQNVGTSFFILQFYLGYFKSEAFTKPQNTVNSIL